MNLDMDYADEDLELPCPGCLYYILGAPGPHDAEQCALTRKTWFVDHEAPTMDTFIDNATLLLMSWFAA